jgi:hypothetical protein
MLDIRHNDNMAFHIVWVWMEHQGSIGQKWIWNGVSGALEAWEDGENNDTPGLVGSLQEWMESFE